MTSEPLIAASWLTDRRTQLVLGMLTGGGHEALVVGGCVRNALMGVPVSDIDIATSAHPPEVLALAQAAGVKAIPTGVEYGTVTLVTGGMPFEVTTYRKDVETDGRRAVVAFGAGILEDAQRRDFTVNALYARADGQVHDPLGGLPDIAARRIRFVGDAGLRIEEDALRMLRFFRFHAWYGDAQEGPDPEALAAIGARVELAAGLSRERVGAELRKLLSAPDPALAVASMAATGLLAQVLPGAFAAGLAPLVAVEPPAAPDWHRRLVALGGEDAPQRLRLSRAEATRLEQTRKALEGGVPAAVAAYRFGPEAALDAALVAASLSGMRAMDLEGEIARGASARFPLRAADLAPQLAPGPELGRTLKGLEARWIASDFALSRDDLLALWQKGLG